MVDEVRLKQLNRQQPAPGSLVVYWMQAAQRERHNEALEYAIEKANQHNAPVVGYFELVTGFQGANARHYRFMLEGLAETQRRLAKRGIRLVISRPDPAGKRGLWSLAQNAVLVVTDKGYLRMQQKWRQDHARRLPCPLIEVETNVVVPVEQASGKEEYSAATLRRKLVSKIPSYIRPLPAGKPRKNSLNLKADSYDISDIDKVIKNLGADRSVKPAVHIPGGENQAQKRLKDFIKSGLDAYPDKRNQPDKDSTSGLSPYLHFGQISPVQVADRVSRAGSRGEEAFLEELIVRRELAVNFVYYNPDYDKFRCLPDWARKTLEEHKSDKRPYLYSRRQLEKARTHDIYWNAAQQEMVVTGQMPGYLRMYWGKKILEWSRSPEVAFQTALYLNNKYELDGGDPNGYAGVAWCFGKHDRPWAERPVFGKVRYMNARGLERKFDMRAYLEKVDKLG